MPKKPVKNALYFYMRDLQQEMREGGKTLPLKEIAEFACPKFKELPHDIKLQYEKLAKDNKVQRKEFEVDRFTSNCVPINEILAMEEEQRRLESERVQRVHDFVANEIATIPDLTIYIVCFNILVATRENLWLPNEFAIAEYSLRDGIKKWHHVFINPGRVPLGYMSDAKAHSNEFTQLPVIMDEFTAGPMEDDCSKILNDIVAFTQSKNTPILLFTHENQIEQTEGALNWMIERASDDVIDVEIHVLDICELIIELFDVSGKSLPSQTAAYDIINQSSFDYLLNTACSYHEDLDCRYCPLAVVKRHCYIISDSLVKNFQLELTPNHLPERQAAIAAEELEDVRIGPDVLNLVIRSPVKGKRNGGKKQQNDDVSDLEDSVHGLPVKGNRNGGKKQQNDDVSDLEDSVHGLPVKGKRNGGKKQQNDDVSDLEDSVDGLPVKGKRNGGKKQQNDDVSDLEDSVDGLPVKGKRNGGKKQQNDDVSDLEDSVDGLPVKGKRNGGKKQRNDDVSDLEDSVDGWPVKGKRNGGKKQQNDDVSDLEDSVDGLPVKGKRNGGKKQQNDDVSDLEDSVDGFSDNDGAAAIGKPEVDEEDKEILTIPKEVLLQTEFNENENRNAAAAGKGRGLPFLNKLNVI